MPAGGWRDGSAVKSSHCTCRGCAFGSQYACWAAQLQGDPMLLPCLGACIQIPTPIHKHTHVHLIRIIKILFISVLRTDLHATHAKCGKEPHLGRRDLGSVLAHTWPDKACHMCILAGKRYCLVFVLPTAEAMRVKNSTGPRKFGF